MILVTVRAVYHSTLLILTVQYCSEDKLFSGTTATTQIPFECPAVFALVEEVEIDNEIFVTCDELKPFYQIIPVSV